MTSYVGAMRPQRDAELAKVHAENAQLRAEIARLKSLTLPDPLGPAPDFDTPIEDLLTRPCTVCGKPTTRELCDEHDDRAELPCDAAE